MKVKVVLQNKTLINTNATYIHLITEKGEAGMLDNHAPIIMLGKKGYLIIRLKPGEEKFVAYQNGILKVANNEAIFLASIAALEDTKEKAQESLDELFGEVLGKSKQENVDFSKIERELFDNIRKGRAGSV